MGHCHGRLRTVILSALLVCMQMSDACGQAVLPAKSAAVLPGRHPLTPVQEGQLLISELSCRACHLVDAALSGPLADFKAPDLRVSVKGLSPEYLRRFLADPESAHPDTKMPDLLGERGAEERRAIAEALTHFLVSQATTVPADAAWSTAEGRDLSAGRQLYHSVGCVACHGVREAIAESAVAVPVPEEDEAEEQGQDAAKAVELVRPVLTELGHIPGKYRLEGLSSFLFQPLRVRSSGRMPDMKLTREESRALAEYLLGEQNRQAVVEELRPDAPLVQQGQRYFEQFRCATCHMAEEARAASSAVSLRDAATDRGCLSDQPGQHPDFHLSAAERSVIRAALAGVPSPDTDRDLIAKTFTTFNCIACHIRDEYGGVPQDYNAYFSTSEKNLGDDGRIPPPLTLVGAKLQPAWLKKVLFDGEGVRPYMATRMPQYGTANLGHLPDILARADVLESVALEIPSPESRSESEREREKLLRTAGRELLGDKGLNCIACHNFNGKPAPVNRGIDMMTSYQRLQSGWFSQFVRNPGAFRPGIIMPNAWPGGIAVHQTILGGDTEQQITAIWYYLSLGTSAADPSGIRWINTKLAVGEEARTYRGRSRVAGFRGIAVGLPQRISYAFNAETGTVSAIWTGDFIGVDRNGQGSGGFQPAADPILLKQDVSLVRLPDREAAWPLLPVMTKDARVNPDPLYPKNQGYQFRGYDLGAGGIPTFRYQTGAIDVEDSLAAVKIGEKWGLTRTLRFTADTPDELWFRVLTGEVTAESKQAYRIGRLRVTVPDMESLLRPETENAGNSELLLHVKVPGGVSAMEVTYEPIQ